MIPPEVAGGILVFTSSFMIASGMETILARPMHVRATYVVGISTLLALSRTVFPDYFQKLPPFLESLTGSALTVGLSAAILLHLLFLLGTRETAEAKWSTEESATPAALEFLRRQLSVWKIDAETAQHCLEDAGQILAHVRGMDSISRNGRFIAMFNGVDLRLDIRYPGKKPVDLPHVRLPTAFRRHDLDNEEAAVAVGLIDFLRGVSADRKQVLSRHGEVVIRLWYGV
jgi:hypothetical protein